jgi:hypothetical protein
MPYQIRYYFEHPKIQSYGGSSTQRNCRFNPQDPGSPISLVNRKGNGIIENIQVRPLTVCIHQQSEPTTAVCLQERRELGILSFASFDDSLPTDFKFIRLLIPLLLMLTRPGIRPDEYESNEIISMDELQMR